MHYWDSTFVHTLSALWWESLVERFVLSLAIGVMARFLFGFAFLLDVRTFQRMPFRILGSIKSFSFQVGLYEGRLHKGGKLCSRWPLFHFL